MAVCPLRARTPPDFTPPYDAFEAKYADPSTPLVAAVIGVQDRGGPRAESLAQLDALLAGPHGPQSVEYGWHSDTVGARTDVRMAYWRDPDGYACWRDAAPLRAWLEGARGLVGHYVEATPVPPNGLDTLIADPLDHWGLATLADRVELTPYHGYWGGTRDRILMSEDGELANPQGPALPAESRVDGLGQIVDVTLPEHSVFARGGPDWSKSTGDERLEFRNSVYPAYVAGGRYLRDNPADAGCYSACLVQATDAEGRDLERNHMIAYFVQLSHLERWTQFHPTHIRIYQRFLKMVQNIGRLPDVNLYHEVSVTGGSGISATYVNCLPSTGLLRFGTVRGAA